MSKLTWDQTSERLYETGVSKGVLYVVDSNGDYGDGVAWNGLTAVNESPSGAEANPVYADNIKYLNLISTEYYGATIEAYTYPPEFAECDGSAEIATGIMIGQQKRKTFGFCYQSVIGNDTENTGYGYKIHLIYGAMAAPSERGYATIGETPEAMTMSWEITTTPVEVNGFLPTASLVIDSTKIDSAKLTELEAILYGTNAVAADVEHNIEAVDATSPRLPLPNEVIELMTSSTQSGG